VRTGGELRLDAEVMECWEHVGDGWNESVFSMRNYALCCYRMTRDEKAGSRR